MTTDNKMMSSIDHLIETPSCLRTLDFSFFKQHCAIYKPNKPMLFCLKLLSALQVGKLDIRFPNLKTVRFDSGKEGPHATLEIYSNRAARKFLTGGHLGFCEAYLDGYWSSPDVAKLFELLLLNADMLEERLNGKAWYRRLSWLIHKFQPNTRKGSQKNIYSHYDIGNDFYSAWLDPSMTYSSALYKSGAETLEQAQDNKYQEMIDRLGIKKDHHVLEIGCGWGGFAEYAAKHTGAKITAITISQAQYDYAVERIKKAGLSDQVSIVMRDYRDIQGQYDRIASIEMFEAVGEPYWTEYFSTIRDRLKKNGKAVIQTITIRDRDFEDYRRTADYIQRYIFPGGMLPSKSVFNQHIEDAGLTLVDTLSFGRDYARTLSVWNRRFQKAWPTFTNLSFDDRFKKLWEQYLCYCEAGFNVGSIDVIQAEITKTE